MSEPYKPFRTLDGWAYRDDEGTLHTGLSEYQAKHECQFAGCDIERLRQWQAAQQAERDEAKRNGVKDWREG
jgi:hypothetical protein